MNCNSSSYPSVKKKTFSYLKINMETFMECQNIIKLYKNQSHTAHLKFHHPVY